MRWIATFVIGALIGVFAWTARAADGDGSPRTLHARLRIAEQTFDPATANAAESLWISTFIMEMPLRYDALARPYQLRTRTAVDMPEVSPDRLQVTVRIRPGIYFADDPAFGRRRELTAEDYVYTLKRHIDPIVRSTQEHYARQTFAGFEEAFQKAMKSGHFDYDGPLEGASAPDRYTLRLKLTHPVDMLPRLAFCPLICPIARDVTALYGEHLAEHPVGTGPYRLAQWRRGSLIVLERNPNYREVRYEEHAGPGDEAAARAAAHLHSRLLPLATRVELLVITEAEPAWLAFRNSELDFLALPTNLSENAVANGRLRPELAQQGITMEASVDALCNFYTEFNMDDPVVGGYTPEKVALRRAIGLAQNVSDDIRVFFSGAAQPPDSLAPPGDIGRNSEAHALQRQYDPAQARALLDTYGYRQPAGQAWRRQPDGSALTIELLSFAGDQRYRTLEELWLRDLKAVGLRLEVKRAEPQALFRQLRAGTFMVDNSGFCGGRVALDHYRYLTSGELGGFNASRFRLSRYDELFSRAEALPPGPEQAALLGDMDKLIAAYAPYLMAPNPIIYALAHKGVLGVRADSPYPDLSRIGFE
ncbi:MAG: bicyclomycin resistance protein [Burkholderiaceae bacterium]|nr:bicyclomycin resistance protein [Burkholderiaceae bacterium]